MGKLTEDVNHLHWRDLGPGDFLRHWSTHHQIPGVFDTTHLNFPDDQVPLWFAIRSLHDRIHAGASEFPVPRGHTHSHPLDALLADIL